VSIFSYNGVSLALVRTKTFRVEPVYDASGVDVKWNKFTISCTGILGPTEAAGQLPYNDASLATGAATAAELAVSLGLDAAAAEAAAQVAAASRRPSCSGRGPTTTSPTLAPRRTSARS
jgi:hypothetical protein